ncbi:hypothetical protein Tsubulata_048174 [Turnera subulata]|uniref:WPP domain-containing protein n=1 Tax=Turnera subulata TaxID=218843 RepID=A0A9Q0F8G6_9ROSI|nr:hypothetical protein Tsubulata_048174 [Turnera subulata]
MTDPEISTATAPSDHDAASAAEKHSHDLKEPKKVDGRDISLSIWPPAQRTRTAVVTRLTETLSTQSVLSKRYGTIPTEEAEVAARRIEEEAFGMANGSGNSAEEDGLEILQLYSREISKRVLETVKARTQSGSAEADSTNTAPEEKSHATPPPSAEAGDEDPGSVDYQA